VRKILIVGALSLVVLVAVYRQRIFVWDPLGSVERDGVRQVGARVFINYSNDVLVEDAAAARHYLVQAGSVPGSPKQLGCVRWLMCWTEADIAPVTPLGSEGYRPMVVMSNKMVSFVDGTGATVQVSLR
jgi:hypothetical protein